MIKILFSEIPTVVGFSLPGIMGLVCIFVYNDPNPSIGSWSAQPNCTQQWWWRHSSHSPSVIVAQPCGPGTQAVTDTPTFPACCIVSLDWGGGDVVCTVDWTGLVVLGVMLLAGPALPTCTDCPTFLSCLFTCSYSTPPYTG